VVDAWAHRDRHRLDQRHGVRVAEVQPLEQFGDCDRIVPVGCEVEVVRIGDVDRRPAHSSGSRVDGGQRAAQVAGDVERPEVIRRNHLPRALGNAIGSDDLVAARVDHVHRVAPTVGHVDQRRIVAIGRPEVARVVGGIHVRRIQQRRDAPNRRTAPTLDDRVHVATAASQQRGETEQRHGGCGGSESTKPRAPAITVSGQDRGNATARV
jgi:hypothetical protein